MDEVHEPALTLLLHVDDFEVGHHFQRTLAYADPEVQQQVQPRGRPRTNNDMHRAPMTRPTIMMIRGG